MGDKKFLDVTKYKKVAEVSPEKGTDNTMMSIQSSPKKVRLDANKTVTDEDGHQMTVLDWLETLEDDESVMVHCPISPESHSNGDATPSCSMKRNGEFLNLKCFGCGQSAYHKAKTTKKNDSSSKKYTYSLPDSFNKEDAVKDLKSGLTKLDSIIREVVRLLPILDKKEAEND